MDKLDRIQQLHQLFTSRRHPIKIGELADSLECTPSLRRSILARVQEGLNALQKS